MLSLLWECELRDEVLRAYWLSCSDYLLSGHFVPDEMSLRTGEDGFRGGYCLGTHRVSSLVSRASKNLAYYCDPGPHRWDVFSIFFSASQACRGLL
jgi:hypothetical protein